MRRKHAELVQGDAEVAAWSQRLIETAAGIRLPELSAVARADALYQVPNRHGVSVVALRRASLSDDQLIRLLRYRLGQYVHPAISIVDPRLVYRERLEHEPVAAELPEDVHFIATCAESGAVLCYAVLRGLPDAPPDATLADRDRPLLSVEKVHGWGVFNRLEIMPDLPVRAVYELGRYVKNHGLSTFDARSARAPVEIGVAVMRTLRGALREQVAAFVGDLEEGIAKQNLDFLHAPTVLIRGTVPYSPEESYYYPRNQFCTVYPFAALAADLDPHAGRLDAIEAALALPGKQGLVGLFRLKRDIPPLPSSLEPAEGLPPLTQAEVRHQGGAMKMRRRLMDSAERMREFDPLAELSDAEMRVLVTFMVPEEFAAGTVIVHQGEHGDDLFLIQSGEVEVQVKGLLGERQALARLGEGDFFGEIALIAGGRRIADVVAVTPVSAMRLSKDAYTQYLSEMVEVEQPLWEAAAQRAAETARRLDDEGVRG
jgi:hypothetical protein